MNAENKCSVKGSDNVVIQGAVQSDEHDESSNVAVWTALEVFILCVFNFLLGCAAYKFLLWRWV